MQQHAESLAKLRLDLHKLQLEVAAIKLGVYHLLEPHPKPTLFVSGVD
jgi:hypothetical protein